MTFNRASGAVDLTVQAGELKFAVEYRASASAGPLAGAVQSLETCDRETSIPLVAVPFMGKTGREICEKAGISWLDLSGNAKITAPSVRIWIEGRPNRYAKRGRPTNLFAPKSSRVARQLLLHWNDYQPQAELVRSTALDSGYISRIVRRLVDESLVEERDDGAIRPTNPSLLLEAWSSSYEFDRHRIVRGHVPARSGTDLTQNLSHAMTDNGVDHAATGLSAAWLMTHFAAHRIVTFYVQSPPSPSTLEQLRFKEEERGSNTWIVIPNDAGVFQGGEKIEGIPCVSPVQVYLDLTDHPERAKEAADIVRERFLSWESS